MDLKFSTSDYVAITLAIAQIVLSIVLTAWIIRRTAIQPKPSGRTSSSAARRAVRRLMGSGLFLLFFGYGMYELLAHISSSAPLSKYYVDKLVFWSFYTFINLTMAIADFFFLGLMSIVKDIGDFNRSSLKIHQVIIDVYNRTHGSTESPEDDETKPRIEAGP